MSDGPYNPNAYWMAVTDARALQADPEASLRGDILISAETSMGLSEHTLATYIREHFVEFLTLCKSLRSDHRDLLLSYYLLSKSQQQLGALLSCTQTNVSMLTRQIVGSLCARAAGLDQYEPMTETLERVGLNHSARLPGVTLATLICAYARYLDFAAVAHRHRVRRVHVRREIANCRYALAECKESMAQVLSCYIFCLTDKRAPTGVGKSKSAKKKSSHIEITDPDVMGDFRIKLPSPHWESVLSARSTITTESSGDYGIDVRT